MKRREILLAKQENRSPNQLFGIDFLTGVHDNHRKYRRSSSKSRFFIHPSGLDIVTSL